LVKKQKLTNVTNFFVDSAYGLIESRKKAAYSLATRPVVAAD